MLLLSAGLGLRPVIDAVLSRAAAQHPDKHVLVVVDRPAHALSHAQVRAGGSLLALPPCMIVGSGIRPAMQPAFSQVPSAFLCYFRIVQRLKAELGLPTAVFCGGDFLYSFEQQFQSRWALKAAGCSGRGWAWLGVAGLGG